MSGKEGLETIRELRQLYPDISVIAMFGGGSIGMLDVLCAANLFGARRTLLKPFTGQELIEAVRHELKKV